MIERSWSFLPPVKDWSIPTDGQSLPDQPVAGTEPEARATGPSSISMQDPRTVAGAAVAAVSPS